MNPKDLAPAHVREIAPYVPGKPIAETARELGMAETAILKLASNENPLGSSPKAIQALRGALGDLAWYAAVVFAVSSGKHLLSPKVYRVVMACLAAFLLFLGVRFAVAGVSGVV